MTKQLSILLSIVLVISCLPAVTSIAPLRMFSAVSQTKDNRVAAGFLKLRAGLPEDKAVIWHYTGILRNPLSGAEIVGVEGLEFNRRLSESEINEDNFLTQNNGNGTTEITIKRKIDKKTPSSTYLSKKVFIYTDVSNQSEAITKFRSGKFAPKRPVSGVKIMFEKITIGTKVKQGRNMNAVIDNKSNGNSVKSVSIEIADSTKVAKPIVEKVNSDNKNSKTTNSKKNQNHDFYAEIEWPGGRKTKTEKISITRESGAPFSLLDVLFSDFKDRKDLGMQYNIINFMRGKPKKPVSRWISFASSNDKASGRSQEYYTITKGRISFSPKQYISDMARFLKTKKTDFENNIENVFKRKEIENFNKKLKNIFPKAKGNKLEIKDDEVESNTVELASNVVESAPNNDNDASYDELNIPNGPSIAVMKYKRYGECPPWYSLGRSSATEITGKRYDNIDHLPSYIIDLIDKECPSFIDDDNLNLDDFRLQKDVLEDYKPWYSGIGRRFRREKKIV